MHAIATFMFGGLILLSSAAVAEHHDKVAASDAQTAIAATLEAPGRPAGDREADSRRQPEAVLTFFRIEPGMTVLDMFSGGGYYTEILSGVVGDDGEVWSHNNSAYIAYAKEAIEARYTPGRLSSVKRFVAENNELELPAATFDAALLILSYHDVYHVDEKNGWPRIDGPKMLAQIYQSIESGGTLGVVDHVAAAGAPAETGDTLHRVDPALLKREIVAAGFEFDGEIDVLRNPDDDHSKPMYAEGIRGQTDRVVYRFRKP